MKEELKEEVMGRLREVYDPELGVNIVDLGLIYDISLQEDILHIKMTLTTPGCPMHDTIVGGVKAALYGLPDILTTEVDVVWEPMWSPDKMSDDAKEQLGYF